MTEGLAYSTVLLKISGEGLGDESGAGIGKDRLDALVTEIRKVCATGAQVGIVLGGGNFIRGAVLAETGLDRATCDSVGMLATVINGTILVEALSASGLPAVHLAAAGVAAGVRVASQESGLHALRGGAVAVFSGGTGNPFFTTDSAGALRAREIGADVLVKATKVDGVYAADPRVEPDAERFESLSYDDVITRGLGIMDHAAVSICKEGGIPILVCDLFVPGNLAELVRGAKVGTLIS